MLVGFQDISQESHKNVVSSVQVTDSYLCGQQNSVITMFVFPGDGMQSNQSECSEGEWSKVELCIDILFTAPSFRKELLYAFLSFSVLRSRTVVCVLN
jgi:hypothetical protein